VCRHCPDGSAIKDEGNARMATASMDGTYQTPLRIFNHRPRLRGRSFFSDFVHCLFASGPGVDARPMQANLRPRGLTFHQAQGERATHAVLTAAFDAAA
jgi:hypothetical protein